MKKWIVSAEVTISIHTDVEAETAEEAKFIAESRGLVGLCHQCARGDPSEEWCTSGELDGEPANIGAEEDA